MSSYYDVAPIFNPGAYGVVNYPELYTPPQPVAQGVADVNPYEVPPHNPVVVPAPQPIYHELYVQPHVPANAPTAPPAAPVLTEEIHLQTVALLNKAEAQTAHLVGRDVVPIKPANKTQAAAPQGAHYAAAPINIDLSDRSWRMFNGGDTHVHHHYQEDEQKEKDQTGLRIFVGIVAVIAALTTVFFIGKAVAEQEDAEDETAPYEDLKSQWDSNKDLYQIGYQTKVDTIIKRMDAISKRQENSRAYKIALLIAAFVAGGTAFGGAVVGSPLLMGAAVVVGVVTGCVALYRLAYACFSNRDTKDATVMEAALKDLKAVQLTIA